MSAVAQEEKEQSQVFDKTTAKGAPGGLFQESMKSIRTAHMKANRLRAGLVVAGLFTDKQMYREVLTLFYLVTNELESKLHKLKDDGDNICAKVLSLGYHFTPKYEQDMEALYESSLWKQDVQAVLERHETTREYCAKIRNMTSGVELAGAAFCLWGALIIGGGPAAKPRVDALCGTTHVFDDVSGPGRNERRQELVKVWDSLAEPGTTEFEEIVASCRDCMQCNNDLITSVKRSPWWIKYAVPSIIGALSITAYLVQRALTR